VLARASADREEVLLVPVDLSQIDSTRTHWPFLRDRRVEAYGDLAQRYLGDPPDAPPVRSRRRRPSR
jgi:N-carbamoylputrescine amidase